MTSRRFATAIFAASLGGCVATSSPRPESTVIFATRDAEVRAKHYRDVAADCSNLGYANVAIVTPPRAGRIDLRREGAIPTFPKDNPRAKCNARPVDGVGVYYRPDATNAGTDRFTIEVIWADGGRWTEDFTVQVR